MTAKGHGLRSSQRAYLARSTSVTGNPLDPLDAYASCHCRKCHSPDASATAYRPSRMLGRLNDVFARRRINIAAQYYQTDGEIGYVVLEAEGVGGDGVAILEEIRSLEGTIRARLLYGKR